MVVVDASVVTKIFLPLEQFHEQAMAILRRHLQQVDEILVPDLLFYEVANALATKTAITLSVVIKDLRRLNQFKFSVYHCSAENLEVATKLSKKHNISVYDAVYAVLAKENKCDLITADEKFVQQANLPFVKALSSLP